MTEQSHEQQGREELKPDECELPTLSSCDGDCQHCHAVPDNPNAPLRGTRFSIASIVAFLLPLAMAVGGGLANRFWWHIGEDDPTVVGVLIGLAVGIGAAWVINRVVCRPSKLNASKP